MISFKKRCFLIDFNTGISLPSNNILVSCNLGKEFNT